MPHIYVRMAMCRRGHAHIYVCVRSARVRSTDSTVVILKKRVTRVTKTADLPEGKWTKFLVYFTARVSRVLTVQLSS